MKEEKDSTKRWSYGEHGKEFKRAGILFAAYYGAEILLLGILRFVFLGVNLSAILIYCIISGVPLALGAALRVLGHKNASDILFLGFTAYSLYIFGERIISEVYLPVQTLPYWLNVGVIWALMLIIYGVGVPMRVSAAVVGSLYTLLTIVNAALKQFRGRGVDAIDFYSIGSAMKVAGRYHYRVTPELVIGILCIAGMFWIVFCYGGGYKKFADQEKERGVSANRIMRVAVRGFALAAGMSVFVMILGTNMLERRNYTPTYSSERNGIVFNILLQTKHMSLDAPDNYDAGMVSESAARFRSEGIESLREYPNVIVIMNEALSDLSVYGELETNIPVFPFLDSEEEHMVKGYVYSSVYAGNTAVSEYEFLTGDSNVLFQTMPYATMIKGGTNPQTLVSSLKELGYTAIAIHPYLNSVYRRTTVYNVLGFDKMLFIDDMEGLEYLRRFATDASQYRTIYQLFEQKEETERLFVFNVTVQNHGDYDFDTDEFTEPIILTQYPGEYKKAEQYLSCVHESDRAFQELTEYFSNVSEPTVILMFGDHQPELEKSFYERVADSSGGDNTQRGSQYLVPYIVWANYELGETPCELTSLNYLQAVFMDVAGLPLTGYQQYLLEMQKEYPVISSHYVMRADGTILQTQNCGDELSEYFSIMYNHMSDISHNPPLFFGYR